MTDFQKDKRVDYWLFKLFCWRVYPPFTRTLYNSTVAMKFYYEEFEMKRLGVALGLSALLLSGSAFAQMGTCPANKDGSMMQGCGADGMQKGAKAGMQAKKSKGGHGLMGAIWGLKLTDTQKSDLKKLMSEHRSEMQNKHSHKELAGVVTEDGFDKDAFLKSSNQRHEEMSKKMAEIQEKAVALLTKEQKLELKKRLEGQKEQIGQKKS